MYPFLLFGVFSSDCIMKSKLVIIYVKDIGIGNSFKQNWNVGGRRNRRSTCNVTEDIEDMGRDFGSFGGLIMKIVIRKNKVQLRIVGRILQIIEIGNIVTYAASINIEIGTQNKLHIASNNCQAQSPPQQIALQAHMTPSCYQHK